MKGDHNQLEKARDISCYFRQIISGKTPFFLFAPRPQYSLPKKLLPMQAETEEKEITQGS